MVPQIPDFWSAKCSQLFKLNMFWGTDDWICTSLLSCLYRWRNPPVCCTNLFDEHKSNSDCTPFLAPSGALYVMMRYYPIPSNPNPSFWCQNVTAVTQDCFYRKNATESSPTLLIQCIVCNVTQLMPCSTTCQSIPTSLDVLVVVAAIPHICHFLYTTAFFGL